MSRVTDLDPIIEYNHNIINKILSNQTIMGLISNDPDIDVESADIAKWESHVEDFNYVEDTTVEDGIWVMVDTEMIKPTSASIHRYEVVIKITCSKGYMHIDGTKFTGMMGSRRDNVARYIDLLLRDSLDYGIGPLNLRSAEIAKSPNGYTSRLLIYRTSDFNDSV